jgi:DNA polymerase-3 subunit chi
VLPELLERTLSRGWRARVRVGDPDRIEVLDNWLWTWRDDSFLPHGTTGERFAERQPILLGNEPGNPNAAQALFAIDTDPGDLEGYERCIVIFDGRLEPALADARSLWSRCKKAGHAITYWRQGETRGWEKQA